MNENLLTQTVAVAMTITRSYLREGDTAIDATCGNGNDTLTLAQATGMSGRILAIDLQEEAIHASRELLSANQIENTEFICGSFVNLETYWRAWKERNEQDVAAEVALAPKDTLLAVQQALSIIAPGGIVTLVLYPGHEEGAREKDALLKFAEQLSTSRFHTAHVDFPNQKKNPPEILWITKK